ncbi:MAG TPA: hypothetical protein GX747_00440 [Tenericutes bacterium]|nr:hypothetical protein [Mycoplasmatota bacterium]
MIEEFFNKYCTVVDKSDKIYEGYIVGREYNLKTKETLGIFIEIEGKNEYVSVSEIKSIISMNK